MLHLPIFRSYGERLNPEEMVRRFLEECIRNGFVFALRRFQQRLPFCTDVELLRSEISTWIGEIRRLRRVCRIIVALAVAGTVATLVILLDTRVAEHLRLLCCLIASAGIVMARNFLRHLPRLKPEPLLVALEYSTMYRDAATPEP